MITYSKGCGGIWLLFHFAGCAWPAGIIPGIISATIGLIVSQLEDFDDTVRDKKEFVDHPYPFQFFAFIVGFVMVFRTNFAYQRYWEALDAVQRMGAKWFDGACMAIAFDAPGETDGSMPYLSCREATVHRGENLSGVSHDAFYNEMSHLFSLMHALALQHLRCDCDLRNIEGSQHDLERSQSQFKLSDIGDLPPSRVPSQASVVIGANIRRGPSLKDLTPKSAYSDNVLEGQLQLRKLRILGSLAPEELKLLESDSNGVEISSLARISMVRSWITRRLIARQKYEPRGDMAKTSPPIVSRLYQVISDGQLGFAQAAKVVDCPFPFPYHNIIRILLWLYCFLVPFLINSKVMHPVGRFTVNFLAVWAYFSLCEVGDNLEDPFVPYDPNELPLQVTQHTFNARLLSLGMVPRGYGADGEIDTEGRQSSIDSLPSGSLSKKAT